MNIRYMIAGLALVALPAAGQEAGGFQPGLKNPDAAEGGRVVVAAGASGPASDDGRECRAALCLRDGEFYVWAELGEGDDSVNMTGVRLPGDDGGGVLYAYSPDNPELLVKVLDGCGYNDHWWVFVGAATDQPFILLVKHIPTDDTKRWDGAAPLLGVNDIAAFPCIR